MNEQGSIAWRMERLGRVSASRFSDVMAGPKSAAYLSYARQLRTDHLLLKRIEAGEEIPLEPDFYSAATAWGKKHEPMARSEYSWQNDCNVIVPPFTVHPEFNYAGASADGVVKEINIGLEAKCPFNPQVHANTLLHGMSDDHIPQVQGGIWIYRLDAWDFVSFDPRRTDAGRYHQQRIERDERYIAALEKAVKEFWLFVMSGEEIPKTDGSVPTLF